MTFSTKLVLNLVMFVSVLTYLGAIDYLIRYLRRTYTMIWVELGSFTFWEQPRDLIHWYIAEMRTAGFVLLSSRYKALQDRKLTNLIWLVRVSFVLALIPLLLLMTQSLIQRR